MANSFVCTICINVMGIYQKHTEKLAKYGQLVIIWYINLDFSAKKYSAVYFIFVKSSQS